MERLFKDHILPLFIICVISFSLTDMVTAKEQTPAPADLSFAGLDKAAFTSDIATLQTAYQTLGGRKKYVAGYRLITLKMFEKRETEEAKPLLEELVTSLEKELEQERNNAEGWALLASLRGMQIVLNPEFASVYAPKIGLEMALASDYGKHHPVVYMLQGLNLYNTPEQFGGSKEGALKLLDRAVELYSKAGEGKHWGMVDAYTWRGQAHQALGNVAAAKADLEKALAYVPTSPWVQGLVASISGPE